MSNAALSVTPWTQPGYAESCLWQLPATGSMAEVPMYSDSNWVDGWPHEADKPPSSPYSVLTGDKSSPESMRRVTLDRHNRRVNVVFVDGHASPVELVDLWTVKWHRRWATPDPRPTIKFR